MAVISSIQLNGIHYNLKDNAASRVTAISSSIAAGEKTVTISFAGTYISSYLTDSTGLKVEADQKINSNSVVFTLAEELEEVITCHVVYFN